MATYGKDVKYAYQKMERLALEDEQYTLVLAIDFGTAFSGYAFSFKSDQKDVKINRNWGTNLGMESYKTPTCILFDQHEDFVSFGYQAQKDYAELDEGLDRKYFLFDFFKMKLHKQSDISVQYELTASNNKKIKAVTVFAAALRFLKGHFLESTKESNVHVEEDDIRWVITVPAIWSFKAKGFMREAALEGGLIHFKNSKKLVIALEPESGSIFCRHLDINQFADSCRQNEMKLPEGTTYIVLDAGGGTLDVSVLKVVDDNKAEEVHCATGGAHGGHYVDINFRRLLDDILSEDFMVDFIKKYPSQWLAMRTDFEQKKRACKADDNNETKLQLLYQLGTAYQEFTEVSIEKAFKKTKGRGIRISNGMIALKHNVMVDLFNDVIGGNVTHLENLLLEMEEDDGFVKPKYIFMVGGFSDSNLLQKQIIQNFGAGTKWDMQVMIPQEAVLAVVKGAVRFGHNPLLITERKAMYCYGIKVRHKFINGLHDEEKKKISENGDAYVHVFDVKIEKNDTMKSFGVGEYSPIHEKQNAVTIELYYAESLKDGKNRRTDGKNIVKKKEQKIRYIDDSDVVRLACFNAEWKGTGKDRRIKVELELEGTEIRLKAVTTPGNDIIEELIGLE